MILDSKDDQIIQALKVAAVALRHGRLIVEFKVQDGKILAGEIIDEKKKLG